MKPVNQEISNRVWDHVRVPVRIGVDDCVVERVDDCVVDRVDDRVYDHVRLRVWDRVYDHVRLRVWNETTP